MSESVSNSTLAVLILAALVVSIVGTYLVLSKPSVVAGGISGAAITGTATFNVTSVASIKFFNSSYATVDFGNINATVCSGATASKSPCYQNTENDTNSTGHALNPFIIENDGGQKVNVSVTWTSMSLTGTGSYWSIKVANTSCFRAAINTTAACKGQPGLSSGGIRDPAESESFRTAVISTNDTFFVNSWHNTTAANTATNQIKVACLNFSDANDTFILEWGIKVAPDESAGAHNSTVTFTASDTTGGQCV